MFFSPLEQFAIIPLWVIKISNLDFSITNEAVIYFFVFALMALLVTSAFQVEDADVVVHTNAVTGVRTSPMTVGFLGTDYTLFHYPVLEAKFIPDCIQVGYEGFVDLLGAMISDNIKNGSEGVKYLPYVLALFAFIISLNIIGLIPYSFTNTSHLIVTFSIAIATFIGVNIVCILRHGWKFFSLFLPGGIGLAFAFLLVPIEFISYFFKPISLSVRLFANMMAGHTLLKVIAGFAYTMMGLTGIMFLGHYIPLLVLLPLFILEFAVAVIQAFVFCILICIYLNDAINLH